MNFAKTVAKELQARNKDTSEVRDVLTGQGYKSIKPKYVSKPNIETAEAHH
jgi:hypothetical protein